MRRFYGKDHPSIRARHVGLTRPQWFEVDRLRKLSLEQRGRQLLTDPQGLVDCARALLTDSQFADDWAAISAGLCLVTGRRHTETMCTAIFAPVPGSDWSVLFTGQLKKRADGGRDPLTFEIPTLVPAAEVIAAWQRLRSLCPEALAMDHTTVYQTYNRAVSKACQKHFRAFIPPRAGKNDIYSQLSRVVYGAIATHWFCPLEAPPSADYRDFIQGHFDFVRDAAGRDRVVILAGSTRSYQDYEIANPTGTNVDGRVGIRLDEPGVVPIQYARDRLAALQELKLSPVSPTMSPANIRLSSASIPQFEALRDLLGVARGNNKAAFDAIFALAEAALAVLPDGTEVKDKDAAIAALQSVAPDADADAGGVDLVALAELLGLDPSADADAVQAAISDLQEQHERDSVRLEQLADLDKQLQASRDRSNSLSQALGTVALSLGLDATATGEQLLAAIARLRESATTQSSPRTAPDLTVEFDRLNGMLDRRFEAFEARLDSLGALVDKFEAETGPRNAFIDRMRAAMGAPVAAPSEPIAAPVPVVPVAAPASSPAPSPQPRSSSLATDVRALVEAILAFNEQMPDGDRFFVSTNFLRGLIKAPKNAIDKLVLHELETILQRHHQQFGLNHTANRGKDTAALKNWILQYKPDLADLPWK